MKHSIAGLLILAGLVACPLAWADGDAPTWRGTVTLKPTILVGNARRPVVAVEVARLLPKLDAPDSRHVFIARSDDAATRRPF